MDKIGERIGEDARRVGRSLVGFMRTLPPLWNIEPSTSATALPPSVPVEGGVGGDGQKATAAAASSSGGGGDSVDVDHPAPPVPPVCDAVLQQSTATAGGHSTTSLRPQVDSSGQDDGVAPDPLSHKGSDDENPQSRRVCALVFLVF